MYIAEQANVLYWWTLPSLLSQSIRHERTNPETLRVPRKHSVDPYTLSPTMTQATWFDIIGS